LPLSYLTPKTLSIAIAAPGGVVAWFWQGLVTTVVYCLVTLASGISIILWQGIQIGHYHC